MRVLAIAGSIRKGSFNRKLLEAARELAPEGVDVRLHPIADIPLYNADVDNDGERPESVEKLKRAIDEADAVLFSTPEYNHTVSGVLQNAIDWASRPGGNSVLKGKPVALMGASQGAVGTARAQQVLKLVLMSTLAYVMPHPGIVVAQAQNKFADDGRLTNDQTRDFLRKFMAQFEDWVERVGAETSDVA